jgi:hypothetical protein
LASRCRERIFKSSVKAMSDWCCLTGGRINLVETKSWCQHVLIGDVLRMVPSLPVTVAALVYSISPAFFGEDGHHR